MNILINILEKFKLNWKYFLIIYLVVDISFTFKQITSLTIDGDLSDVVTPATNAGKVLKDPFGFNTIKNNDTCTGPNRFFVHYSMSNYFTKSPAFFQNFVTPINSIYVASGVFTLTVILSILFILSLFVLGIRNGFKKENLLIICLLFPLVHIYGFNESMGITNSAVTYTFFYTFSIIGLFLMYLPIVFSLHENNILNFSYKNYLLLIPMLVFCAFNGPLLPPLMLIISLLLFIYIWNLVFKNNVQWTKNYKFIVLNLFIFLTVLFCFYSLFLGTFNQDNTLSNVSIVDRYKKLPIGIIKLFLMNKGFIYLELVLLINFILIYKFKINSSFFNISKWLLVLILLYVLLLPLGGYRDYRPFILRNDTALPIILVLFYLLAYSTFILINGLNKSVKYFYLVFIFIFLFVNIDADGIDKNRNKCEKMALQTIAESNENVVKINKNCTVMDWGLSVKPEDSKWNAILFYHWGITKKVQLYYQE
jgi:hypothetical protein